MRDVGTTASCVVGSAHSAGGGTALRAMAHPGCGLLKQPRGPKGVGLVTVRTPVAFPPRDGANSRAEAPVPPDRGFLSAQPIIAPSDDHHGDALAPLVAVEGLDAVSARRGVELRQDRFQTGEGGDGG